MLGSSFLSMERMWLRGTDGRQWAFQSTNDPQAHAASIRLPSSPQQCIRDVIVQVSSKQPPPTKKGQRQESHEAVSDIPLLVACTWVHREHTWRNAAALSLAVRGRAGLIRPHPRLQSRDDFPRYRAGYRLSHHMNERWEKLKTDKGRTRGDHRMADARVRQRQRQQQRMSVPLVVIVGGVGALRIGAGHSSGTQ